MTSLILRALLGPLFLVAFVLGFVYFYIGAVYEQAD